MALNTQQAQQQIADEKCGAYVLFLGTVRNHSRGKSVVALEFEAYEPMVISELEKIAREINEKWKVNHILLHHRTGKCTVGDVPVIAAIASAHRAEALLACGYLMDRLKQTVPIWKKELFEGGEEWVSQHP